MSEATSSSENRGVGWLLWQVVSICFAIAGPGLGAIALMALTADLVSWKGSLEDLASLWETLVSSPIWGAIAQICERFEIPSPPEWVGDYLGFGFVHAASMSRQRKFLPYPSDENTVIDHVSTFLANTLGWIILAPFNLLGFIHLAIDFSYGILTGHKLKERQVLAITRLGLVSLPFLFFAVLFSVNIFAN